MAAPFWSNRNCFRSGSAKINTNQIIHRFIPSAPAKIPPDIQAGINFIIMLWLIAFGEHVKDDRRQQDKPLDRSLCQLESIPRMDMPLFNTPMKIAPMTAPPMVPVPP